MNTNTVQAPVSVHFPTHDLTTAPEASRTFLEAARSRFGFVPLASARYASAPAVLEAFEVMLEIFAKTSLTLKERETVALVLAGKLDCKLCRDLHRRMAEGAGLPADEISALIERRGIGDHKLNALARFTERVVETRGAVSDDELKVFIDSGFTPRHALEVLVGISTYTLSIFANRLTRSESLR